MAKSLVENLSEPWEPGKYHDRYRNELLELLKTKAKGSRCRSLRRSRRARSST